jgi:hypothetical protein
MLCTRVRLSVFLVLICCALPIYAQPASSTNIVPSLVKFTGALSDTDGRPLTGTVGVTFLLYKDQTGGAPLWAETQNVQADKNGHYSAMLGSATAQGLPADVFVAGEARWLAVQVSGQAEQPRTLLLSVPYALKALDAETIGGLPASAFVRANPESSEANGSSAASSNTVSSSATLVAAGNGVTKEIVQANTAVKTPGDQVGYLPMFTSASVIADSSVLQNSSGVNISGALNIAYTKDLNGGINAAGPVTAQGFVVNQSCCGATAFSGIVGAGEAIYGGSNSGTGVYGNASSGVGVSGSANSGTGVNGSTASGTGVYGSAKTGTAGVYGVLSSGDPTYSYGVYGENDSAVGGKGVFGTNPYGTGGIAVQGYATGTNAIGVAGSTNTFGSIAHQEIGATPIGVIGDSKTGIGIMAASDDGFPLLVENSGTKDAVFIYAQGGGYPIVAQGNSGYLVLDEFGNLSVTGAIVGAVKDFRIDHPLDPANKYLYHASIESAEMKDLYDGVALLDSNGSAIVMLPDWFEAVNGDFRYQLTAMGAPAPNLHIAQEISNGQFTIAGGQPGIKVSWQVTGVRHDAYAKAHPLQVTVDKPEPERGYYIHPELYGAPLEKSLASVQRAVVMQQINQK